MPIPPHPIPMVSLHLSSTINTTRTRPSFTPTPIINNPRPSIFPAALFHLLINNSRWLLLHRQPSSLAKKEIRAETLTFLLLLLLVKLIYIYIYMSGLTQVCPGRPGHGSTGFLHCLVFCLTQTGPATGSTGSQVDPPGLSRFNNCVYVWCFWAFWA
jgi:hypothetical protein